MKKPKFWFTVSGICAAIFVVKLPLDYLTYCSTLNSAPFWVTILVNGICFLIPAAIAVICGLVLRKRGKK